MSDKAKTLDRILPWRRYRADEQKLKEALHKARLQRDREREKRRNLEEKVAELERWLPERAREGGAAFCLDGLATSHTPGFLEDPTFEAAYGEGAKVAGEDYRWHWRVHVAIWTAKQAFENEGDFVELGAGKGFLAAALQRALDWPAASRTYWMFDTFEGLVADQISPEEFAVGRRGGAEGRFTDCFGSVRSHFENRRGVKLVRGVVPDTLDALEKCRIAFCSIDMNCAMPEIEAADRIWPLLSPGAWVLLDDYAYDGYEPQRIAWDRFAAERGVAILSLPTGQGLWRKPEA